MPPGFRSAARFAGGPFSFSIAIHLAIILALVIAVHETRACEPLIITIEPRGSIHPSDSSFSRSRFPTCLCLPPNTE